MTRDDIAEALGARADKTKEAIDKLVSRNILGDDGVMIDFNEDILSWKKAVPKPVVAKVSKDGLAIAEHLFTSICFWDHSFGHGRASRSQWRRNWGKDIDKLLKFATPNEIKQVIDNMSKDKDQEGTKSGFSWRRNIKSGSKLYEKWDTLRHRYGPKSNKPSKEKRYYDKEPTLRPGETWEDYEWKGPDIDKIF